MSDLIGLWRLDKGSGLIAFDESGYGNNGDLEGINPTWVDGKSNKAVNFPGTNERIDCGNGAPLDDIGNGSFWISFWMKSPDEVPLNNGMLFSKLKDTNNRIELFSNGTNNRLYFVFSGTGAGVWGPFSVDSTVFDTIFNHIVLVINRTTDKAILYMNTTKDDTEIDISALPVDASNTGRLSWGARNNGSNPYEGVLDEMRIYTGVPTQEDIDFLFKRPDGIPGGKITPWLVSSKLAGVPGMEAAKMIPPSIVSVAKKAGEPSIEKVKRPLTPSISDIKGPF